jgi:hypothetical protein
MAVATLPANDRPAAGHVAADSAIDLAPASTHVRHGRPLEVEMVEVLTLGRDLAVSINNQLVLPVGVLELLAAHKAVPSDLRPMLTAARDALRRTASQAEQLQAVIQPPA